jgi:hypothetical protein
MSVPLPVAGSTVVLSTSSSSVLVSTAAQNTFTGNTADSPGAFAPPSINAVLCTNSWLFLIPSHQQTCKALMLWLDLVVLAIKNMAVKCVLKTEKCMMNGLWLEEKWCSGALVTFLVLSCLVGSGLALVAPVARPNQSLPVFLM